MKLDSNKLYDKLADNIFLQLFSQFSIQFSNLNLEDLLKYVLYTVSLDNKIL